MATKWKEVTEENSCFNKCGEEEPIFILRAQDKTAPAVVRIWAMIARLAGASILKTGEAHSLANEMERWQKENPPKIPD